MARITATLTTGMAVQRKRLAQIAERCPVHKTLAHGVEFEDNASFGPGGQR